MSEKICISDMTLDRLTAYIVGLGQPKFRAKQIFKWLHQKLVTEFAQMTDQPKTLLSALAEQCTIAAPSIRRRQQSRDGTVKYLLELADGNCIETVLMKYRHGNSICISTEVGCKMGCVFCASTQAGFVRRLAPSEILDQVLFTQLDSGEPISNIVLMGIGEPLDNYENTVKFLHLVNSPERTNISLRNISLSTCGLVPQMRAFAEEGLPVTLSISLHAPNDEVRKQLLPVANAYAIEDVLAAAREYVEKTGRRVIFEYALVKGVNSELRHADELASRLRGLRCHVNLIPLNAVRERDLTPPARGEVEAFLRRLEARHISATVRREMGADIEGACGQLRRRVLQNRHQE